MAFRRKTRSRLAEALDMTPLIDVVFLLLIFLLISTTFKKKQLAMELNLPRVGTQEYRIEGREHQIRVDAKGGMFLCPNEEMKESTDALKCSEPASQSELVERFKRLNKQFTGVRLGVYADSDVPYHFIARVVMAAMEAGIDLNLPYEPSGD